MCFLHKLDSLFVRQFPIRFHFLLTLFCKPSDTLVSKNYTIIIHFYIMQRIMPRTRGMDKVVLLFMLYGSSPLIKMIVSKPSVIKCASGRSLLPVNAWGIKATCSKYWVKSQNLPQLLKSNAHPIL